ncbi:MAG: ferritin-like domain-containing protein [Myxococcota bacterium]
MSESSDEATGTLRVGVGEGPLRTEHQKLLRNGLRRGNKDPETAIRSGSLEGTYHDATLKIAKRSWLERMRFEHMSAAVFSRLLPQLIEAGATVDVKTGVLRMSMDELRHSALCGDVVELLGGEPVIETRLTTAPLPEHSDCTPAERALRNVMFVGCMSETIAVSQLSEEFELASEPSIRAVIDQLMTDEVWHAKLGWSYLAEVWPTLDRDQRARTEAYLPRAFSYLEEHMVGPTRDVLFQDDLTDELNALGISAPQDSRDLFYDTVTAVTIPRLSEFGMNASNAWNKRGRGN